MIVLSMLQNHGVLMVCEPSMCVRGRNIVILAVRRCSLLLHVSRMTIHSVYRVAQHEPKRD